MHNLITPREWMLRSIVSYYDYTGDDARFSACVRAAQEEGRLLTSAQVRNQVPIKSGQEMPDYVIDHFYRLFPWNIDTREKPKEAKVILLAAE